MNYKFLIISCLVVHAPVTGVQNAPKNTGDIKKPVTATVPVPGNAAANASNVIAKPVVSVTSAPQPVTAPIAPAPKSTTPATSTVVANVAPTTSQATVKPATAASQPATTPTLERKNASVDLKASQPATTPTLERKNASVDLKADAKNAVQNTAAAAPSNAAKPVQTTPATVAAPVSTSATVATTTSVSASTTTPVVSAVIQPATTPTVAATTVVTSSSNISPEATRGRSNSLPITSSTEKTDQVTSPARPRSNSATDTGTYVKDTTDEVNKAIKTYCKKQGYAITDADKKILIEYVSKKPYSKETKVKLANDLIMIKHSIDAYVKNQKYIKHFNENVPAGKVLPARDEFKSDRIDWIIEFFAFMVFDFLYAEKTFQWADGNEKHVGDVLSKAELINILNDQKFITDTKSVQPTAWSMQLLNLWNNQSKIGMDSLLEIWLMQAVPNLVPETKRILTSMNVNLTPAALLNNVINQVIQSGSYTLPARSNVGMRTENLYHNDQEKAKFLQNKLDLFKDVDQNNL